MSGGYYKYPRTPHLPFSPGVSKDDCVLRDTKQFVGKEVVVTEKMDGENTTIYRDYYHARSINSTHYYYHSFLLGNVVPMLQQALPDGYRLCGEYMYAMHAIRYPSLSGFFLVFSLWDDKNMCQSWDDTVAFCKQVGIPTVPELWRGIYDEKKIKDIAAQVVDRGGEGIVIRDADAFAYSDFAFHVAKYVRAGHVNTDIHWSHGSIIPNELCSELNKE